MRHTVAWLRHPVRSRSDRQCHASAVRKLFAMGPESGPLLIKASEVWKNLRPRNRFSQLSWNASGMARISTVELTHSRCRRYGGVHYFLCQCMKDEITVIESYISALLSSLKLLMAIAWHDHSNKNVTGTITPVRPLCTLQFFKAQNWPDRFGLK